MLDVFAALDRVVEVLHEEGHGTATEHAKDQRHGEVDGHLGPHRCVGGDGGVHELHVVGAQHLTEVDLAQTEIEALEERIFALGGVFEGAQVEKLGVEVFDLGLDGVEFAPQGVFLLGDHLEGSLLGPHDVIDLRADLPTHALEFRVYAHHLGVAVLVAGAEAGLILLEGLVVPQQISEDRAVGAEVGREILPGVLSGQAGHLQVDSLDLDALGVRLAPCILELGQGLVGGVVLLVQAEQIVRATEGLDLTLTRDLAVAEAVGLLFEEADGLLSREKGLLDIPLHVGLGHHVGEQGGAIPVGVLEDHLDQLGLHDGLEVHVLTQEEPGLLFAVEVVDRVLDPKGLHGALHDGPRLEDLVLGGVVSTKLVGAVGAHHLSDLVHVEVGRRVRGDLDDRLRLVVRCGERRRDEHADEQEAHEGAHH